jgi:twitching motility two-component system response regulator PilH
VGIIGHFISLFRRKQAVEDEVDERRLRPRINPREGTRVLVIDDSPTILTAMKRFVESAGCVFLGALDAKMGMEVALTQKPELIFLDIVMPGINGFAALRALRKNSRTRDIPIIMMSGNEQAKAQFFGAHIGADDFMKKPFSRFEVFGRITRLLDADRIPRRPPMPGAQEQPAKPASEAAAATPTPAPEPVVATPAPTPAPQAAAPVKAAPEQPVAPQAAKPAAPAAKQEVKPEAKAEATPTKKITVQVKAAKPAPAPQQVTATVTPKQAKTAAKPAPAQPTVQPPSAPAPTPAPAVAAKAEPAVEPPTPVLSAQVVSFAPPPTAAQSTSADAPTVPPELLTRIARLAQLAQTDPEALKALAVLASQLVAKVATAKTVTPPAGAAARATAT